MGARGPVPKRSSERRRRNKESKPQTVKPPSSGKVRRPPVKKHWHPIAKSWYTSLGKSGQAIFFEPSDWQAAIFVAEMMTKQLKSSKPGAQLFAAIWSAMTDLLTTEAARRRVRMEVEREGGDSKKPAGVTAIDDYRRRLTG